MPDVYSQKDLDMVNLLCRRMFKKCKENCLSYRQIGVLVKAQPATIWRWFHGKSIPSRHHVYHMKKFMGYLPG